MPRDDSGYSFEIKWDGVRGLTYIEDGQLHMESRNLKDFSRGTPRCGRSPNSSAGTPRSSTARSSPSTTRAGPASACCRTACTSPTPARSQRRMVDTPVLYVLFDVLWLDGESKMKQPYTERRAFSRARARADRRGARRRSQIGAGAELLEAAQAAGAGGRVAKRRREHLRTRCSAQGVDQGQVKRDRRW